MRMYDRALQRGVRLPISHEDYDQKFLYQDVASVLRDALPAAVPFELSNVAEYCWTQQAEGKFYQLMQNIESAVPPFPLIFAEWDTRAIRDPAPRSDATIASETGIRQGAMLVMTKEWDDADAIRAAGEGHIAEKVLKHLEPGEDVRWCLEMMCFLESDGQVHGPVMIGGLMLRPDGSICRDVNGGTGTLWVPTDPVFRKAAEEDEDVIEDVSRLFALPFVFACSLAHCKNVALEEQEPLYASRQERRAAERNGEKPRQKFYTLVIEPLRGKEAGSKRGPLGATEPKSFHVCRGHFATYSEEKPLFGKYAGRFWIPAHVRGKREVGLVGKDYAVVADGGNAA